MIKRIYTTLFVERTKPNIRIPQEDLRDTLSYARRLERSKPWQVRTDLAHSVK